MSQQKLLEELSRRVGEEVHVSDWFEVTQERINAFADATGDHQWIHVDVARAARESPWRSTIVHGYLTLSLYPMLRGLVPSGEPPYPGVRQAINYGLDRLRFPSAVRAGSRVRARCRHPEPGRHARLESTDSTVAWARPGDWAYIPRTT
jgi:acyl dehydratase